MKKRRLKKVLVMVGFIFLVGFSTLAGISTHLSRQGRRTPTEWLVEKAVNLVVSPYYAFAGRDRINIVIVGADRNYDRKGMPLPTPARSDTILVISLRREGTASILSIPRDTLVRFGEHLHKINAVHAAEGPQALQQLLAEQFGIDTHYFIQVNFDSFVNLVDLVGGVDIFVEHDLHYDDNWGKLHIHLQKGLHHLDGKKALGYVRYRKGYRRYCPKCKVKVNNWDPTSDFGRMKRQHTFLKALTEKLLQPKMVIKLPRLVSIAHEHIATDIDLRTILSLANFAKQIDLTTIKTQILVGDFVQHPRLGSVFVPDLEKTPQMLADLLGTTFFFSLWEQGEGSIGTFLKISARPNSEKRRHEKQATATSEDNLDFTKVIPIQQPHLPEETKQQMTDSQNSQGSQNNTSAENNPQTDETQTEPKNLQQKPESPEPPPPNE